MWMAVFADAGASLIVVANGLRLLSSSGRSAVRRPSVEERAMSFLKRILGGHGGGHGGGTATIAATVAGITAGSAGTGTAATMRAAAIATAGAGRRRPTVEAGRPAATCR